MSIWESFKKWALAPDPLLKVLEQSKPVESKYDPMVGEPVISFLDSLERDPKRYKLEKVLKLTSEEFPQFTCYHWMKGAGHYTLTDRKTGTKWGAYVHTTGSVWEVYGLPFNLNHWELTAIWEAFHTFRKAARVRQEDILERQRIKMREAVRIKEQQERLNYADLFKEDV